MKRCVLLLTLAITGLEFPAYADINILGSSLDCKKGYRRLTRRFGKLPDNGSNLTAIRFENGNQIYLTKSGNPAYPAVYLRLASGIISGCGFGGREAFFTALAGVK